MQKKNVVEKDLWRDPQQFRRASIESIAKPFRIFVRGLSNEPSSKEECLKGSQGKFFNRTPQRAQLGIFTVRNSLKKLIKVFSVR